MVNIKVDSHSYSDQSEIMSLKIPPNSAQFWVYSNVITVSEHVVSR